MKTNMGGLDRTLRLAAAAVIAVLLILHAVKGTLAVVLAVVAAIFLITTLVGVCPAYVPFGLSTRKKDKKGGCCPH